MGKTHQPAPVPSEYLSVPDEYERAGGNIYQRLNRVQLAVDYIQKEKKSGMRYSIVSHDAVTAKVRPLMVAHGVIYYPCDLKIEQNGNRTQVQMIVRFQNIDDPADHMDVHSAGYGLDDQDKGPGKAISYAVKYALLKALGLESGDDPDEDQETVHVSAEAKKQERAFDLALEEAKTADELAVIEQGVRADYKTGKIEKALAQGQLGKIRQKASALTET